MKYRPEIDGLRALAVVPVILCHAGFHLFSGGFVGVDVFFVISGYLITTILIEDIENKRFSLVSFYERRVRRILPSLFFVMFVCIPFAWIWMLPSQMKDFSQSLIAVSLFVSNILFWQESGYFDSEAKEKPLLHTWSLAVEEQYYLLFPIFLILAWRFGKQRVFWMIAAMAIISLLLSEWGWHNKAAANFYLAPTRAWELFAGSIAALIVQRDGVKKNNTLALTGLAAIVFSIFAYDEAVTFPSVYALVPVLGVMLLVLYADKETLAAKLLSSKLFVGVGLISYSAYLWHQPLFAFARIRLLEQPSGIVMLILSLMSVAFAYLSWRYIETPFRRRDNWKRKEIFCLSFLGTAFFGGIGFIGHANSGFENRFTTDEKKFLAQINENNKNYVGERFTAFEMAEWEGTKKKVFLVGDSYAQDLTNAIYEADIDKYISLSTWKVSSRCGNLFLHFSEKEKFIDKKYISRCFRKNLFDNQEFKNRLKLADEIWLASSWKPWQVRLIEKSLKNIQESSTAEILIFGRKDFPEFKPRKYLGFSTFERADLTASVAEEKIALNKQFVELTKEYNFIDVQSLMCGGYAEKCKLFDSDGYLKTYDGGHLTKTGAEFYGRGLKKVIGLRERE